MQYTIYLIFVKSFLEKGKKINLEKEVVYRTVPHDNRQLRLPGRIHIRILRLVLAEIVFSERFNLKVDDYYLEKTDENFTFGFNIRIEDYFNNNPASI